MTSARPAPQVLTFGEAMAMFVAGTPGSLDEVEHYTRSLAGAETNVATGLARLGHSTGWIGRVGDDPFGRFIHTALSGTGIDTAHVTVDPEAPTGFQLKSHAGGGDPEVVYFRKNSAGSRLAWDPALESYIGGARHLHITGIPLALSASTRDFAFRAVQVARDHGVTVSFDTNLRPVLWPSTAEMIDITHQMVALADIVLPGASEGQVLLGTKDPIEIGRTYLGMGATTVIVKDGGLGATVVTREEVLHRNVFPVQVVDTVGAGDGFAAGFISGTLDRLSTRGCLRRAAAVGAMATTSPGDRDGLPTRLELTTFLRDHAKGPQRSRSQLAVAR
jgi:sugar/nucleoside kinase (ribokinase family)